jgi:trehalose/maltose hydrolase-like predicted phosphorylase
MPALLGSSFFQETILSLTDGDRNKYQPLEAQIVTGTFAPSQHGLCGFHLVDCSIVSNPFGKPGAKKEMAFQAMKRQMKKWLYS